MIKSIRWLLVTLIIGANLTGCAPAVDREQVEDELVAYTINSLILLGSGDLALAQPAGEDWVPPADASLILWAPPEEVSNDTISPLKEDEPIRVWWLVGNELFLADDGAAAMDQYRGLSEQNIEGGLMVGVYYEFGIMSLSGDGQKAEVYLGMFCGPLCGAGYLYALERNEDGGWEVKGEEMQWIS